MALTMPRPAAPATMVPPSQARPPVLPTDRLTAAARLRPDLRTELRRIPNVRNAFTVLFAWVQVIAPLVIAVRVGHPLIWVAAFIVEGRSFALLAILAHEAAHRLLFTNHRANDFVGTWLLAYPAFVPLEAYRQGHLAHHRDEMGPDEPDTQLYADYPISKASMARKLTRDALGVSGWKNFRALLGALRSKRGRPIVLQILGVQAVLALIAVGVGHPWLWLLLWFAPWMTAWRVLNRLRAIAEHGGMVRSADRRETTHVIHQSLMARFWIVPYNTGWHLAHHVDIAIPWRKLPALHDELVAGGWITPALEYRSYIALWRALSSRPAA